jgi:hypothetical protein
MRYLRRHSTTQILINKAPFDHSLGNFLRYGPLGGAVTLR